MKERWEFCHSEILLFKVIHSQFYACRYRVVFGGIERKAQLLDNVGLFIGLAVCEIGEIVVERIGILCFERKRYGCERESVRSFVSFGYGDIRDTYTIYGGKDTVQNGILAEIARIPFDIVLELLVVLNGFCCVLQLFECSFFFARFFFDCFQCIPFFYVAVSLIHSEKESDDDTETEEYDGNNLIPVFFFGLEIGLHKCERL